LVAYIHEFDGTDDTFDERLATVRHNYKQDVVQARQLCVQQHRLTRLLINNVLSVLNANQRKKVDESSINRCLDRLALYRIFTEDLLEQRKALLQTLRDLPCFFLNDSRADPDYEIGDPVISYFEETKEDLGKAVPLTRAAVQSVLPVEDFPTVEENAYQHVKEVLLAEQQHTALHNKNDPVD
jgi:hypothetical protein